MADSAFLGCNRVQRIELGEGIEQIGTGAFAQCTRLEQLILPATLNIIENNAFAGDTKLADIRSFASTPPELKGSTVFQRNRLKLMRLWVGCESAEAYKKVNIWNDMQMLTSEYFLSATAEGEGEIVIKSAGCDSMQLIALAADHYRFAGWSNQTDADTLIVILESDTTISALFNPEIYEVRFYADEKLLKTDSVEAYKSAVAPEPPELEGYEFVGWDKDFSSVLEDMEVNAIYEVRSGVEDLFNLSNGEVTVYTIDGRMIRKEVGNLTTGIYILRSGEEARIIVIR